MFITDDDYLPYIKDTNLTRMIEADPVVRETAEDTALAVVRDSLHQLYDVDTALGASGNDRNRQLVRWVIVLALYYMYERLPANIMPARVRDNYNEVMAFLKDVEDGKKPMTLPRRETPTGQPQTKFRYGFKVPPRGQEYN